jgi:hypothetical protein|uniref:Uncharacterized protein n=1 Tax=Myoviridae sp. ctkfK18 TaxID=2825165 RepID=A0A8S5VGE2_9CAUD|nr:MAG TPA: hypothetical protein [Myoviridae sp. ctkfK18]
MVKSVDYYQHVVNNFIREDLVSTNDLYQHEVNLFCYLKDLYSKVKSEFNIVIDDIDVIRYLDSMLNQTQKNLYMYHNSNNEMIN